MTDTFSLFESENNPLKESMKKLLEQLPNNSDQVKSMYKSLLLVHISKIKDPQERSTWLSFLATLDNLSQSDKGVYSFGVSSDRDVGSNFEQGLAVSDKSLSYNFYKKNLKIKAMHAWNMFIDIITERKKALKCVMLISLRLRYVETFWRWQLFSGGLEKISCEFYSKNLSNKVIKAWKGLLDSKDNKFASYERALQYWAQRRMLIVFINWADIMIEAYRLKKNACARNHTDKKFFYEDQDTKKTYNTEESGLGSVKNTFYVKRNRKNQKKPENPKKSEKTSKAAKKLENMRNYKVKKFFFEIWELKLRTITFGKLLDYAGTKLKLRQGFRGIRSWVIKGLSLNSIDPKYSIESFSDYELSVKISILERRLSSLHQQLFTEQITNRSLLVEKQEYINLCN
jgi:hypothetical protein